MRLPKDWNAGGSGLPFFLPGAIQATRLDRSSIQLRYSPRSRRRRAVDRLLGEYEADEHEPEVWHAKVEVGAGDAGTSRVTMTIVRCTRCDTRTKLTRFWGSEYKGGPCEPLEAQEIIDAYTEMAAKEAWQLLWGMAVFLGLIGIALVGNVVTEDGGWRVAAASTVVLGMAALLVLGGRSRRRQHREGTTDPFAPWWKAWWGRTAALGAVLAVSLVVMAQGQGGATLIVRSAHDAAVAAAPECPIVPDRTQLRVLGVSVPTRDLRATTIGGDSDGFACNALSGMASLLVRLTCVQAGTDPREVWAPEQAPFPVESDGDVRSIEGAQVLTWRETSRDIRGVVGVRGDLSVQIVVFGKSVHPRMVQDEAVRSAVRVLDYGRDASHIECAT